MPLVRLKPITPPSQAKHSTLEPQRSYKKKQKKTLIRCVRIIGLVYSHVISKNELASSEGIEQSLF